MAMKTPRRQKSNLSSSSDTEKQKDPVNVYCRIRNLREEEDVPCLKLISSTILSLTCPSDSKIVRKECQFEFKHIFTAYASQKEVFDHVAFPLLADLLKGKNGLLFTYGVTGSGKTYTLTGDAFNPGVMPRCVYTIFNTIQNMQAPKFVIKSDRMNGFEVQTESDAASDRRTEAKTAQNRLKQRRGEKVVYANDELTIQDVCDTNLFAVFISYTEIYNNTVFDLLDESGGKALQSKIIREDCMKNMYVNGVVEVEVKSAAEAFELFHLGQKRKRMAHTNLNAESSRSHSIFNIRVVQLCQGARNSHGDRIVPDRNLIQVGQLSLVDLAGSERSNRTQTTGVRLKEASCINNSLMSLRTCMEILRDNQLNNANRLVPYRDSRLTLLFKNYFEGEGKVEMIVCVNPSIRDYDENLQVMKFAEMAKDVKIAANVESRYTPYRKAMKGPTRTPCALRTPLIAAKLKVNVPLVFGPKLPKLRWDVENLDATDAMLKKLEDVLATRKLKSAQYARDLLLKEQHFRNRLQEKQQEYTLQVTELRSVQTQLKKEKKKSENLEIKVLEMERMYDSLEGRNTALNVDLKQLKTHLDEKDVKINRNIVERQKQKQRMAMQQEKFAHEMDEQLRRQRDHYNAECMAKDMKLQKVRQLIDADDFHLQLDRDADVDMQSEHISDDAVESARIPLTAASKMQSLHSGRNRIVVVNRRRSRSLGESWLEHNVVKPLPMGTVLQPSLKKRKSVTKLKNADDLTNAKQSKYCLIAQEADADGEVETKVYKADILPTCGGGAQVIFNDVERLRQESPITSPYK